MSEQQLDFALDLMRRLPPAQVTSNLAGLIDLVPDLTEDLLSSVDQPLKIAFDTESNRDYLLCDYNRDGDSYRSPWSSKYDPPLDDGNQPSAKVRQLEVQANAAFEVYKDQYYEGGSISSVYMWDVDTGFAGVVLIKKISDVAKGGSPMKGTWDAVHVFQVDEKPGNKADYKLTTTIMLSLETENERAGVVNLSGTLTRQQNKVDVPVTKENTHIANIGSQIEVLENTMRQHIEALYFGRTKDVINDIRKRTGFAAHNATRDMQKNLMAGNPKK